ncbi:hypothetical protein M758_8G128000 [Ceratodon purpureus]|nr:hypothetical protein M758_8G128000 [Ceratodon purpureus]
MPTSKTQLQKHNQKPPDPTPTSNSHHFHVQNSNPHITIDHETGHPPSLLVSAPSQFHIPNSNPHIITMNQSPKTHRESLPPTSCSSLISLDTFGSHLVQGSSRQ